MDDKYPYKVYSPEGHVVLQSAVRHPKCIELAHLEAGYTIKLNGRKITKKEIKG